jgi:hypothetical protein
MARDSSRYPITYRVEHHEEPWTRAQVLDAGRGACDAIVTVSIIRCEHGVSQLVVSLDGDTGEELTADELWSAWTAWAYDLMQREDLGPGKRTQCRLVHEQVEEAIAQVRDEEDLAKSSGIRGWFRSLPQRVRNWRRRRMWAKLDGKYRALFRVMGIDPDTQEREEEGQ